MTIEEHILAHMNQLRKLATQEVYWMEESEDLDDYVLHVTQLEFHFQRHADQMIKLRERAACQIAAKCGYSGRKIYGNELRNIRIRKRFAYLAEFFTRKPPEIY